MKGGILMNQRQKKKYGLQKIKPEELWNLDFTLSKYIYPRLKAFKKMCPNGYPGSLDSCKEWKVILDKIIAAFELLVSEEIYYSNNKKEIINEGLNLFAEYYQSLWD